MPLDKRGFSRYDDFVVADYGDRIFDNTFHGGYNMESQTVNISITKNGDGTFNVDIFLMGTGDTIPIGNIKADYVQSIGDIVTVVPE